MFLSARSHQADRTIWRRFTFQGRRGRNLHILLNACLFLIIAILELSGSAIFSSTLRSRNVGEALQAGKGFATSIVLTTLVSWPVEYFLGQSHLVAQIALPPLTVVLSLLIMMCPWLTFPNLMILVMYVVIAAWDPIGYMGSYLIGLGMAVLMHILPVTPPVFSPNTAKRQVNMLSERLSKDFFHLFVQARYYTKGTGQSPTGARAAGAAIEVLVSRITASTQELKRLLPAVRIELNLDKYRGKGHSEARLQRLGRWIQVSKTITVDMELSRCALNSRFLGEQENENSATITISSRHIRLVIAHELGQDYDGFIDALIQVAVACNRQANPTKNLHLSLDTTQLLDSLGKTRRASGRAVKRVTKELDQESHEKNQIPASTIPVFARLTRRSTSLNSLLFHRRGPCGVLYSVVTRGTGSRDNRARKQRS